MRELVIETTEGLALRYEVAGAGSRTAASLVDCLLLLIGFSVVAFVVLFASSIDPTGVSSFALGVLAGGMLLGLSAYQILFGVFRNGQTPGKSLLGIRVLDEGGHAASWVQHVLRGLFWPLEVILLVPVSLGMLLIAATARHQRLGDLVAGTLVLREPEALQEREPFRDRVWRELPDRRLGLSPAVATRFEEQDVAWLRRFYGRPPIESEARDRILTKAAPHFLSRVGVEGETSPREIDRMLRELYVFLREFGVSSSGGRRKLPR